MEEKAQPTIEPAASEPAEPEVARWVQVLAGLILGLLTLLLSYASASLLLDANRKSPLLALLVGFILLLGCIWVFEKCWRLLTGRKNKGGLMTPTALRILSLFCLLFPITGIFTGYYQETGPIAIFQAAVYFSAFLGLRALARRREAGAKTAETSEG